MTELDAWAAVRPLAWNDSSRALLHDALARATPRPWAVDLGDQEVVFREPSGGEAPDRAALYRCGAALAAAWTVLRVLGHDLVAEFPAELPTEFPAGFPRPPGPLAVLRVIGRSSPADQDWRRYAAIRDLTAPGTIRTPAPPAALPAIVNDGDWAETDLSIMDGSARPMSEPAVADHGIRPEAELVVADERGWSGAASAIVDHSTRPMSEPAVVGESAWPESEPAPVRPQWPLAAVPGEASVLVLTAGSARRHHVLAGAAVHQARLSAAACGFGTEVITGPRPRAVAQAAALPGFPHALLRFGILA